MPGSANDGVPQLRRGPPAVVCRGNSRRPLKPVHGGLTLCGQRTERAPSRRAGAPGPHSPHCSHVSRYCLSGEVHFPQPALLWGMSQVVASCAPGCDPAHPDAGLLGHVVGHTLSRPQIVGLVQAPCCWLTIFSSSSWHAGVIFSQPPGSDA